MNVEKQKLILENLISSKDLFSRCVTIIKSNYFVPELRSAVSFLLSYYDQYHAIPSLELIKAESDVTLQIKPITRDAYDYTCDTIEKFCKESAMAQAILQAATEMSLPNVNMGKISEAIQYALLISLPKDLGIELYHNPEDKLQELAQSQFYISTGSKTLDLYLGGGLARKQFTLFSANSGGGKSIMLANLGANFSRAGYNVLYLSLELDQPMIYLRLASIISGVSTRVWKSSISEISHKIKETKKSGAGSYIIKKIATGSTANDIRSYLKLYELEFGYAPDVLLIDYLDLMAPNEGVKNMGISEQDKLKSEQVVQILNDYNCIGISASQQNRDAIRNNSPDQGIIAGGLTKVNTVDNYISIFMDVNMRLSGQMMVYFLKTRSSDGVGKAAPLKFNPNNLIICDTDNNAPFIIPSPNEKTKKPKSKADEILNGMKSKPETIPTIVSDEMNILNQNINVQFEEFGNETNAHENNDLLSLIDKL